MIVGYLRGEWRQDRAGSDLWHFSQAGASGYPAQGSLCLLEPARLGLSKPETPYGARLCRKCWDAVHSLATGQSVRVS
jgi:hypothetical protein